MRLLLDQNLSHRLVQALADIYADCQHVRNVGLKDSPDTQVWSYARSNGCVIVSKDSDFYQRSLTLGSPPKVIWIRLGNCTTKDIEQLLRRCEKIIKEFDSDDVATVLVLP